MIPPCKFPESLYKISEFFYHFETPDSFRLDHEIIKQWDVEFHVKRSTKKSQNEFHVKILRAHTAKWIWVVSDDPWCTMGQLQMDLVLNDLGCKWAWQMSMGSDSMGYQQDMLVGQTTASQYVHGQGDRMWSMQTGKRVQPSLLFFSGRRQQRSLDQGHVRTCLIIIGLVRSFSSTWQEESYFFQFPFR